MTTAARVIAGISGQGIIRATLVVNVLATVPLMLSAWGLQLYGEWLVLLAFGSYVVVFGLGLPSASAMAMISAASRGDYKAASIIFAASFIVLTGGFAMAGVVLVLLFDAVNGPVILNLHSLSTLETHVILGAVIIQAWAATIRSLFCGASNAAGVYGRPDFLTGFMKMAEFTAVVIALIFFHVPPLAVGIIYAASGIFDAVGQYLLCRRTAPWAVLELRANPLVLLSLLPSALGHVVAHVTINSVLIQGPRLALSFVAGPPAVAVFSVTSTLVRTTEHVTNLVLPVLQLEFARAKGYRDYARSRLMIELGMQLTVGGMLLVSPFLGLFGMLLFKPWTNGTLDFDPHLFAILLAATGCAQVGRSALVFVLGGNMALRPSLWVFGVALTGLAIGAGLAPGFGPSGMATGLMLAEAFSSVVLLYFAAAALSIKPSALLRGAFNFSRLANWIRTRLLNHRSHATASRPIS